MPSIKWGFRMRAKKLPSGNAWIVTVYAGKDPVTGKTKQKSFTGLTKAEAERKAAAFSDQRKRQKWNDPTVGEALAGYIAAKEAVLSPSTVRGYERMLPRFDSIQNIRIRDLTGERVQLFISELSEKYSAKTVKNVYGLLVPSVALYAPDLQIKATLPTQQKIKRISPSDADVGMLFDGASDKMKKCIALAAFGSMRRGEICALKYKDIAGNVVSIHADIVQDKNNKWIYKEYPKTEESTRELYLHDNIIRLLGSGVPDAFVVGYADPGSITQGFIKLRKRFGSSVRFHDLRHYYASIGAALGIPALYLASFGGWRKDSPIMLNTYQNEIAPIADQYARAIADHAAKIVK